MKRLRIVIPMMITVLIAGGLLWTQRSFPVTAGPVTRGPLLDVISATGVVEARSVILSPKVSGRVASILVREGESVRAGQLLISLSSEELAAQVTQARAAVEAAGAQHAQAQAALRLERSEVEGGTRQAEAQLAAAKAQLSKVLAGARAEEIRTAQAQVAQSQAALEQTERNLQRMQELYAMGAIPRAQVEGAQTTHHTARAQLQAARESLSLVQAGARAEDVRAAEAMVAQAASAVQTAKARSELLAVREEQVRAAAAQVRQAAANLQAVITQFDSTSITAPFSGTVVRLPAELGQVVASGTPLVEVADLSDRWVAVPVESDDLPRFRAAWQSGAALEVTTESFPGRVSNARVSMIASVADRSAFGKEWTVRVKLSVDDPQNYLRPGMEVDVDGRVPLARDVLHLPKNAVVEKDGQSWAFAWDGSATRRIPITTGLSSLDEIEVVDGLREREVIVVSGLDHLRNGHRVTVRVDPLRKP